MPRGFALITGSAPASGAMKHLIMSCLSGVLTAGVALVPNRADALLLYTIRQVGEDVVVTGGTQGLVDLSGLTIDQDGGGPIVYPNLTEIKASKEQDGAYGGVLGTGPSGSTAPTYAYSGISGPDAFGSGTTLIGGFSSSGTSNAVYLCADCDGQFLFLPVGYSGGSQQIFSKTTFSSANLQSLGLTPNTSFTWKWGARGADQTFQLDIEPVPAPLPLLGAASAYGWSRRLRRRIRKRAAVAPGSTTNI